MKTITVNNVEFRLDMYNTIKNFSSIDEIPFTINSPIAFENNDGLRKLKGELYNFKSDSKVFNCIFKNLHNEELVLTDFDVEQGLNELLNEIADEKTSHIRENWQDERQAKEYDFDL